MISLKKTLSAITSKFTALNTLLNDVPHYTLLWTNPSPTSTFAAQTISSSSKGWVGGGDTSGYDLFFVTCARHATTPKRAWATVLVNNTNNYLLVPGGNTFDFRTISVNSTGFTISGSTTIPYYNNSTLSNISNDYVIPQKIYGIKFGGGYNLLSLLFTRKEVFV